MPRKSIGAVAMTAAQRQQRYRDRLVAASKMSTGDVWGMDPETIAARIFEAVPPEKADRIAAALCRRLAMWRVGTFDPARPHITGGAR